MESFFRYIAYVDYYKNGDKVRNVGFLRWKLHKDIHYLEIQIKDVGNYRGQYDIQEKNTQKVIGEIVLDKGIGNFSKGYPSLSASGEKYIETRDNRLYLYDVEGLEIRLNENEYLSVDVKLPRSEHFQMQLLHLSHYFYVKTATLSYLQLQSYCFQYFHQINFSSLNSG